MIIRCPGCRKRYRLDDSKRATFERQPRRCPRCGDLLEIVDENTPADQEGIVVEEITTGRHDQQPERIGPYIVESLLGKGGMGSVYKAWEESLHRHVAVKVLAPAVAEDGDSRRRFLIEARALAKLVHPNITQIYSADEEGNLPYFAMEFIVGRSTEQMLKQDGPLSVAESLRIVRGVCRGLEHAQEKGIIHRDIKPGNILLAEDGQVKITDFGIAKVSSEDQALTKTGMMVGTPAYISPEQAKGDELDFRSDIYSLGVTFYEFLLGRPPFTAGSNMTVIVKHISEPVQFPLRPDATPLPPPLTGIIRKMLAKDPARRYLSYEHLLNDLDDFERKSAGERQEANSESAEVARLTGMTSVYQPVVEDAEKLRSRNRTRFMVVGGLLLAVGIGAWQWFDAMSRAVPPRPVPEFRSQPAAAAATTPAEPTAGSVVEPQALEELPRAETNVLVEQLSDTEYRIFGTVRNTAAESLGRLLVTVSVIDEFEEVVATKTSGTDPERILPGETARFSTLFRDIDSFDRYQLTVQGVAGSPSR